MIPGVAHKTFSLRAGCEEERLLSAHDFTPIRVFCMVQRKHCLRPARVSVKVYDLTDNRLPASENSGMGVAAQ